MPRLLKIAIPFLLLAVLLGLAGCASKTSEKNKEKGAGNAPGKVSGQKAAAAPDSKWEAIKEAAKKEGEVVVIAYMGNEQLQVLRKQWDKAGFGVNLKITTMKGAEFGQKVTAERKGGIFAVDVALHGANTLVNVLKKQKALEPIDENVLVLPEVKEPSVWWGGKLPYIDPKDKTIVFSNLTPSAPLVINTSKLKPGEVASFQDLLKPEYKGKIVVGDFRLAGTASQFFGAMLESGFLTQDYFKKLKEQMAAMITDEEQMVQWVAQGKYPIGVVLPTEFVQRAMTAGAPILDVIPKEGTYASNGPTNLVFMNKAPHPNGAKLFINWYLSKEVQAVMGPVLGHSTAREDVELKGMSPSNVRQKGVKYFNTGTEEFQAKLPQYMKIAKEIYGEQTPKK